MKKLIGLNLFLKEAFLFTLTLALGIGVSFRLSKIMEVLAVEPVPLSLGKFLIYFAIATLLILIFLKTSKKGLFFQVFYALAVFAGAQIVFSLFTPGSTSIFLAGGLVLLRFYLPQVWTQNLAVILSVAGIGGLLGLSISPLNAVIILVLLSVYDIIAVYKTKHMVKMAEEMIKRRVILALVIPEKTADFWTSLKKAQPGKGFLILGAGDLALPLILASSVMSYGFLNSLLVAFFALIGLGLTHLLFISQKKPKPMPALPPIALFSILGFLISLLF